MAEALHCDRRRREYGRLSSLYAVEKGPHWLTGCSVEMGAVDTSVEVVINVVDRGG